MASSEIYRDLLLKKRHGLPLWKPESNANLPMEYKKQGISIGDLGLLTDDGGFDYLFNIHADADDPVNQFLGTPASFTSLPHNPATDTVKTELFHPEQACITHNAEFEMMNTVGVGAQVVPGVGAGVVIHFTITDERAAMLVLPHGADRNEAKAYGQYRDYVIKHGESWYEYLNVTQRREARNDSLYLVTGCDKSYSWGLAAGSPQQERSVKFNITAGPSNGSTAMLPASGTVGFHASWRNTGGVESRHYPRSSRNFNEDKNQCIFARGFIIGINENFFKRKLKGKVRSTRIDASSESFPAASNNIPLRSPPRLSPPPPRNSVNESGLSDLLDQNQDATDFDNSEDTSIVIIRDYPEYPNSVLSPGSYICKHLLSSQPDINLVVVHDNNWMAVSSSDAEDIFTENGPDYERLTTHVLKKSYLQVTQGRTLLLRRPYQDLAMTIEAAIPDLLSALKDNNSDVRAAATLLENELSKRGSIPELVDLLKAEESYLRSPTVSVFREISKPPHLTTDRKKDKSDIRYATAPATTGLSKKSDLIASFRPKNEGYNIYQAAVSAITESSKQSKLVMGTKESISDIHNSLKDKDYRVREAAVKAITEFLKQKFAMATMEPIPDLLTNEDYHIHGGTVKAITEFSNKSDLVMAIKEVIPDVLDLLKDEEYGIREAAVKAMTEFSKQPELVIAIRKGVLDVLSLLKDDTDDIRQAAVKAITEFLKQSELVMAIKEGIPNILRLLKNDDYCIREAAVKAIAEFSQQSELVMAIKEGVPDILNLLADEDYVIRQTTISVIIGFLKQSELIMAIKEGIPDVLNLLKDKVYGVFQVAVEVITEFSKHPELVMAIKEGIPDILNFLKDEDYYTRRVAVKAITEFSKQSELVMAVKEGIPDIFDSLEDKDYLIREAAVKAITEFSKQPELVMATEEGVSDVLNLLGDEHNGTRQAAISVITEFSKQSHLVIAVERAMPILLAFLKHRNSHVRAATVSVIHTLYKQCIISL